MKKLFSVLTLGIFFTSLVFVKAQDHKMFIGGNLEFGSTKDVSNHFGVSPVFGYWLNDKSAIVVNVNFHSTTTKGVKDVTGNKIGFGAEYRYGWHLGDMLYMYVAPGVGYSTAKQNTDVDVSTKTLDIGLNSGLMYMISPRWSINSRFGNLGYSSVTVGDGDAVGSFGLSFLDHLDLGLNYHF